MAILGNVSFFFFFAWTKVTFSGHCSLYAVEGEKQLWREYFPTAVFTWSCQSFSGSQALHEISKTSALDRPEASLQKARVCT